MELTLRLILFQQKSDEICMRDMKKSCVHGNFKLYQCAL